MFPMQLNFQCMAEFNPNHLSSIADTKTSLCTETELFKLLLCINPFLYEHFRRFLFEIPVFNNIHLIQKTFPHMRFRVFILGKLIDRNHFPMMFLRCSISKNDMLHPFPLFPSMLKKVYHLSSMEQDA